MIVVKMSKDNKEVILECTPDIATSVISSIHSSLPVQMNVNGENLIMCVGVEHIDRLNKELASFKKHIVLDKTFTDWKNKYKGKQPVIIRAGVISSKIYKGGYDIPHRQIEDVCKFFFMPAVRQKRFKEGKWDGYIHLYKKWLHEFPTGLLDKVCDVLKFNEIPYKVEYAYDTSPSKQFDWKAKDLFKPEDDQWEALDACIKGKRGVCKAPTGFGKTSFLARYLTVSHGVPTLFIANKKVLVEDAAKDFISGIEGLKHEDVTSIKDGSFCGTKITSSTTREDVSQINQPIIVATIQSLSARLKDSRTKAQLQYWLRNICKFVMIDETQAVGTPQWDEVLNEIRAPYRICLSATPRRTDGGALKIFAASGPLLYDTSAEAQIANGRLCELDIQYHPHDHHMYNENDGDLVYSEIYQSCIVNNIKRNDFIAEKVLGMLEEERFVLILIQIIDHGHVLKDTLIEHGLNPDDVKFIWGDTPDKIRNQVIDDFRKGKFKVMIGSTIADAGLDIKLISGVILAGAGNSDITLIQRIGRGARNCNYEDILGYNPKFITDNDGKKVTKVIDILDDNVAFFKKQAKNRFYNAREEFGADRVHIVGADQSIFRARTKRKDSLKNVNTDEALKNMFSVFEDTEATSVDFKESNISKEMNDFLEAFK